jgi:hypothetical protein
VTEKEYRAHEGWNYSTLKNLLYGDDYFLKSINVPFVGNDATRFGTAFHAMALEPARVNEVFRVQPVCDRRTTEGKKEYARFYAGLGERVPITVEQAERLGECAKSIQGLPLFGAVSGAIIEEPIIHQLDGVVVKGRPDAVILGGVGGSRIDDIKTIGKSGFHVFKRAFWDGYCIQVGAYSSLVEAFHGKRVTQFVFHVVHSEEPFESYNVEITPSTIAECKTRFNTLLHRAVGLTNKSIQPQTTFLL